MFFQPLTLIKCSKQNSFFVIKEKNVKFGCSTDFFKIKLRSFNLVLYTDPTLHPVLEPCQKTGGKISPPENVFVTVPALKLQNRKLHFSS